MKKKDEKEAGTEAGRNTPPSPTTRRPKVSPAAALQEEEVATQAVAAMETRIKIH